MIHKRSRYVILGSMLLLLLTNATFQSSPTSASSNRVVLFTNAHLEQLRQRIAARTEPTYSAYQRMREYADSQLGRQPNAPTNWFVPFYYENKDGHVAAKKPLQDDANIAYQLGLMYQMTRDEKYAITAARLINGWASRLQTLSTAEDSMLTFSYHFPAMIIAADLIEQSPNWPADQQVAFQNFVRVKALPMNTMARPNNWGNWGLVLVLSSAAYLDDPNLFNLGVARWKEFIETQIGPNGEMVQEVDRSNGEKGIYYSHFSLTPQTIAAEIMRVNGVNLYDYVSPSGRTLRKAFEQIAAWSRNPSSFPYYSGDPSNLSNVDYIGYFEILNARWYNVDASALLLRERDLNPIHTTPRMTFAYGNIVLDSSGTAPAPTPVPRLNLPNKTFLPSLRNKVK